MESWINGLDAQVGSKGLEKEKMAEVRTSTLQEIKRKDCLQNKTPFLINWYLRKVYHCDLPIPHFGRGGKYCQLDFLSICYLKRDPTLKLKFV